MPVRISRDGSQVEPHAIKLEEMYRHIFVWFKEDLGMHKTDVIRNAVEKYFESVGGDLKEMKAKCVKIEKASKRLTKPKKPV